MVRSTIGAEESITWLYSGVGMARAAIDIVTRRFARRIHKVFKPDKIILFGSRANGTAWEWSDYDFIIVSDSFIGVHWLDRISSVVKYWTSKKNIDVLPYTKEDFARKKAESSMIREAIRHGLEV